MDISGYEGLDYLDKEEYKDIVLCRMDENDGSGLPFYIRKYSLDRSTLPHRHQFFQINYVFKGKARHLINHNEVDVAKGDIFVIPPYIPHCIVKSEDSCVEIFELEFEPEFVDQHFTGLKDTRAFMDFMYIEPFLVSEAQVKPRLNLIGKMKNEVENILIEILNEYTKKASGFELLAKSLLLKLLVIVGREFTKELENYKGSSVYDRHRDAIFESMEYINNHYMEDITIEDAAGVANLSVSYYRFIFKSNTSQTFVEYINGLRISKAMDLLKTTNKRVLDVCMDVGFNNVDHFCRLFKQYTGSSPLQYRKSFK